MTKDLLSMSREELLDEIRNNIRQNKNVYELAVTMGNLGVSFSEMEKYKESLDTLKRYGYQPIKRN